MAEYPEEYRFQEYPKYLYHEAGAATIVQSADEQKALGAGWHEKIADLGVETCPAASPEAMKGSEVMPGFTKAPAQTSSPAAASPPAATGTGGRRGASE